MEFMNNLNALLVEKMGPLGPLVAVGGLGVLLVVLVLPTLLKRRIDPLTKLRPAHLRTSHLRTSHVRTVDVSRRTPTPTTTSPPLRKSSLYSSQFLRRCNAEQSLPLA